MKSGTKSQFPYSENFFYPREINPRGFSSSVKNFDDNIALASGSSIFPRYIFNIKKIFELEEYKFGMIWNEFALRLNKKGVKIRILKNTYVNHFYNETDRSYNCKSIDMETKFFMILVYNLIYKKNILNISQGIYEIIKELIMFNPNKILYLYRSIKMFLKIKKRGFWNFNKR